MDESILTTIKKLLGLAENYTPFDTDILVFINGSMLTLQQLGIGPKTGFAVTGYEQTWKDLNNWLWSPFNFNTDTTEPVYPGPFLEAIKQYIYLCVKMVFDPPANSFVMTAMQEQKAEYEWRLRENAEFFKSGQQSLGYWQQIAADEAKAKAESIDDGIDPFNGLRTIGEGD